jgi:hypothetical protein
VYNIGFFPFLYFARRGDPYGTPLLFNGRWSYIIPNSLRITRMTTITSKTWTALPERGIPE